MNIGLCENFYDKEIHMIIKRSQTKSKFHNLLIISHETFTDLRKNINQIALHYLIESFKLFVMTAINLALNLKSVFMRAGTWIKKTNN